jgi:anhydro-N-acetylmuramic acid kinase
MCRADVAVGQRFADLAVELAETVGDREVDLVASHGQTVLHGIEPASGRAFGTLQLGQASIIAERTGATVVSDLRNRDIAAGGEGAPLVAMLDRLLTGSAPQETTAWCNLGGIANITVLGPGREPIAYDVGPGNALIDAVARQVSDGALACDRDGALAAAGTVDPELLEALCSDPYFVLEPPKSTGRERFNLSYVTERLQSRKISAEDLLATCTTATAVLVAAELQRLGGVERVYASGGGTRNPVLMAELSRRCAPARIELTDVVGLPEGAKEACLVAVLGLLSFHGLAGTIPSCTGARHPVVLGTFTPGRRWPEPLSAEMAPEQLVIVRRSSSSRPPRSRHL